MDTEAIYEHVEEVKTASTVEDLAAQYGWKEGGEKSAEDYVKLALDKFPDQSKKIKQLFRTVEELKEHMSKSEARAYEKAKQEIDAQRKQAIRNGDEARVEELDKAKEELLPSIALQKSDAAVEVHPAISEFESRNEKWLNGTSYEELKIQQWVEAHGAILGRKRLPVEEHMALLEEHVKKEFADYFDKLDDGSDSQVKNPVSSSRENLAASKSKVKSKFSFNDLSSEQKKVARDFENLGVMSVENYIKDLVKHGELK